jgi:hypothetical protein
MKSSILEGILGVCYAVDVGFVFGTHIEEAPYEDERSAWEEVSF